MSARWSGARRAAVMFLTFSFVGAMGSRTSAQTTEWETYLEAGVEARKRAEFAKAEKLFSAALREAERLEPNDRLLAISLNALATLYVLQAKYDEAEPLFKRALAIVEKALEPDHPEVRIVLENLAKCYEKQGRSELAKPLRERAETIRQGKRK